MSLLFEPIKFGSLTLSHKIIIAPMCQYSASHGLPTYWHAQQWGTYALSGASLVILEACAVQEIGRISYADLGLWNDAQRDQIKTYLDQIKTYSPVPFAVQLAHAGRKASTDLPWLGGKQIPTDHEHGWQTVSASDIAHSKEDQPPHALSIDEIEQVKKDFVAAAKRAVEAGLELIEIHAAHGYLLHQFLSPLSNERQDQYGGSLENRIRLTLEVVKEVKAALPQDFPVGVRLSATDWMPQGWDVDSSVKLSQALDQIGVAYIHVSSGGLHPDQDIKVKPGYQVDFAAQIKAAVNTPVIAVGLITDAEQAEDILQKGEADAIAIARAQLYDPRWAWHAAAQLSETIEIAPQYLRSQPHDVKKLFKPFQ